MFYCECGRIFQSECRREQHISYRIANSKPFQCNIICCRSFYSEKSLCDHKMAKEHWIDSTEKEYYFGERACSCGKICHSLFGLQQHQNSSNRHFRKLQKQTEKINRTTNRKQPSSKEQNRIDSSSKEARQNHLMEYYLNAVQVKNADKKASVETVRDTLSEIMENVIRQPDGDIYSPSLRKAGSHASKTKIGKADEFDWAIPLNLKAEDLVVKTNGSVPYRFSEQVNLY